MKLFLNNTTILITGASSGMGEEIARKLASEAKVLILVARRKSKLIALATELQSNFPQLTVHALPCDLTDINALHTLSRDIYHVTDEVDVLINTAGIGQIDFFETTSFDAIQHMVQLNILSFTYLTREFLPSMIKRGHGGILNFSSFFGLKTLPGYAAYAGTKFYVSGFTETLRAEVAGTGVVVSGVFPGPVRSAFWDIPNAKLMGPPSFLFISVEQCVRSALNGFRKGRAHIIPGLRIKLFLLFLALTPAPIERRVNAGIARMTRSKLRTKIQQAGSSQTPVEMTTQHIEQD